MIGAYVFAGADDRAIYIGSSKDVADRVRSHRNNAPSWWPDVVDVWTFPEADVPAARKTEKHLIHVLRPYWNKNHAGMRVCPCGCSS